MARIAIVTPARPGARNGNRHTAQRWAGFLRELGHRVSIATEWNSRRCDLLIALHAKRSHGAIVAFRAAHPEKPVLLALTGTDLYRDLPASKEAHESLRIADRIIVLQDDALRRLAPVIRKKARVVYQSADPSVRHAPPADKLRVAVIGHLRKVKDPFRAARALSHLDQDLEVVQVGEALEPGYAGKARAHMRSDARYRWLGGRTHPQALAWIARSHLLVVSSVMEGGANVISEAMRIGTPVLASRMSGNLGMLGRAYPGYFPLYDERALAGLIRRCMEQKSFHKRLKRAMAARRARFSPAAERKALRRVIEELRP